MPRLLPLLLLLLLQPRAAAAEELAYGYLAAIAAPAASPAPEAPAQLLPADGLDAGASTGRPGDRPDRVPPESALRPGPAVRAPRAPFVARASAGRHAGPCSPHCERLPYDATAPPLP